MRPTRAVIDTNVLVAGDAGILALAGEFAVPILSPAVFGQKFFKE